jgi:hypothetical protein
MDSLCSKIAPKIMIFLYEFLLDGFGIVWNGFSFVGSYILRQKLKKLNQFY